MRGTIYIIQNKCNDKYYVGQTKSHAKKRFSDHKSLARAGRGYILHASIRKYGEENFYIVEEIQTNLEELNNIEREKIIQYNSIQPYGYNILDFGSLANLEEGWWKGKVRAESTKQKISETKKKNPAIGEKNPFYGKKHSDETKKLLAEKNKDVWYNLTPKQKEKHKQALKGHPTSEETRRKISKANKGKKRTKQVRENMKKANLGKKLSEETREKISKAHKGRKKSEQTKENMKKAQRAKANVEKGKKIHELLRKGLKGVEIAKIIGCTSEFIYAVKKGRRYSWIKDL